MHPNFSSLSQRQRQVSNVQGADEARFAQRQSNRFRGEMGLPRTLHFFERPLLECVFVLLVINELKVHRSRVSCDKCMYTLNN